MQIKLNGNVTINKDNISFDNLQVDLNDDYVESSKPSINNNYSLQDIDEDDIYLYNISSELYDLDDLNDILGLNIDSDMYIEDTIDYYSEKIMQSNLTFDDVRLIIEMLIIELSDVE